jgi:hypothetical protein
MGLPDLPQSSQPNRRLPARQQLDPLRAEPGVRAIMRKAVAAKGQDEKGQIVAPTRVGFKRGVLAKKRGEERGNIVA